MKKENYYIKRNIQDIDKINELIECLPPFCEDYFMGIESADKLSDPFEICLRSSYLF
ncbi:MAG: hypothetical protein ACLRSW_08320 [Christensenellaceae bacterium]